MKFEIENISVMYPNEEKGINRKMILEDDTEFLHFNFVDTKNRNGVLTLNKDQVILLKDTLNLILKNKLII